ncbi:glutathione peroxidase [Flavicella sediminum]|uniref:glutathione peroxidase n=1 Tax=Flavicella sediminum TaxID=2585141 RepID=UPI00111C965A|nr:glutathione peroxidase [Flavicella sediminum]
MKYILLLVVVLTLVGFNYYKKTKNKKAALGVSSIYDFKVKDLQNKEFDFSSLKGKKIMIVNTASKCGLTPQYEGLQKLYETYKDDGFVIVGFPSNDFLFQEPGTADEIASFCQLNYGVTFPMMQKVKVKGSKQHPVYQYLTKKVNNGLQDSKVKWNFQKYLINREGALEMVISPKTKPNDAAIISWIEK